MKNEMWNVQGEDRTYQVSFEKNKIRVNQGDPVKITKFPRKSNFFETTYFIDLGGKNAELHSNLLGKMNLVFDGIDCRTGEAFIPLKLPFWGWIFIALHFIDLLFLLGGALGGVVWVFMSGLTTSIASNTRKSTGVRVLCCLGLWIAAVICQFAVLVAIASIM